MTKPADLPQDVVDFILKNIDSVEQLEILLLLRETAPRIWTHDELSHSLHSTNSSIEKRLSDLCSKGFVRCESKTSTYNTGSDDSEKTIQNVIETYKTKKTRVIELIFSKPNPSLIGFANAFKLRKDK
jgi:hypothetical protein